jgi:hypothetical protein
MGELTNAWKSLVWRTSRESDHLGDLNIDGRMILKLILEE